MTNNKNIARVGLILPLLLALYACASQDTTETTGDEQPATEPVRAEYDPWEPMNRKLYAFNDVLDRYTLRWIAKGYKAILPGFSNGTYVEFPYAGHGPSRSVECAGDMLNAFYDDPKLEPDLACREELDAQELAL